MNLLVLICKACDIQLSHQLLLKSESSFNQMFASIQVLFCGDKTGWSTVVHKILVHFRYKTQTWGKTASSFIHLAFQMEQYRRLWHMLDRVKNEVGCQSILHLLFCTNIFEYSYICRSDFFWHRVDLATLSTLAASSTSSLPSTSYQTLSLW